MQEELTSNYLVEGMGMPSGPMSALLNTAIKVYPNPSRDGWNIALPLSSENIQLALFDITGKEIMSLPVNGQQTYFIENKPLPSGVYILKILLNNETVIKKIAKF